MLTWRQLSFCWRLRGVRRRGRKHRRKVWAFSECNLHFTALHCIAVYTLGVEGGVTTTVVRAPVLKDGPPRVDYSDKSQQNYVYAESTKTTGIRSWRLDRYTHSVLSTVQVPQSYGDLPYFGTILK